MTAVQIKSKIEVIYHNWKSGNIGWRNYNDTAETVFGLLIALTDIVAKLESKQGELKNG